MIRDTRAVSEGVSQALLFMTIVGFITLLTVGSLPVVEQIQSETSFEQNVASLEELDEVNHRFTTIGSQSEFASSSISVNIPLVGVTPDTNSETQIIVRDSGETYRMNSTVLRLSHNEYDLVYDTGILTSSTYTENQTHKTPANHLTSDSYLSIMTLEIEEGLFEENTLDTPVFISEYTAPEYVQIGSTAEITIETRNPHGWEMYLDDLSYVDNIQSSQTDGLTTITADISNEITLYHHRLQVES